MLGDPAKAEKELGWKRDYSLKELVDDMMKSDLEIVKKHNYLKSGGFVLKSYFGE